MDGTGEDFRRMVEEALRITDGDWDQALALVKRRVEQRRPEDAAAAQEYDETLEAAAEDLARSRGWEPHPDKPGIWRRRRPENPGG